MSWIKASWRWCTLLVALALIIVALAGCEEPPGQETSPAATRRPAPQLHLLSSTCTTSHGYVTCEGFVRNVSRSTMHNVMIVITWVDSRGRPQTTDDALINYNPVLAGQESPWKTIGTDNPELTRYRVSFKELMGGTIRYSDRRR